MVCIKCKADISADFLYCPWCGKKQIKTTAPKTLKRTNGTGTVYKLSGRRKRPWVAATNKQILGYYEEKSDAAKALELVAQNGIPDGYNETVAEVYERWKGVHFRDLTDKGKEGYMTAWDRLSPIHGRKMRTIKTADFQKIVDSAITKVAQEKEPQPLSRSGKEKIKQLCSQLCKRAIQDDIINRNYAEFVRLDREDKKEKLIFTSQDIEALFKNDSNTARIVLTLIYTGMRINELFGVKLSDTKLTYPGDGAFVGPPKISHFVGGEKTEAGRNRIIPVNSKIMPFISEWYSHGNEYLIFNSAGGFMDDKNFRSREYYPLLEVLGIEKKSPHSARHTFASLMSSSGVRPEVLQKIIGHANYSTTAEIYIHSDIDQLQEAINQI